MTLLKYADIQKSNSKIIRANPETHPRKLFLNVFSRYKLMQRADRHENKDTQRMIKMWTNDCRLCQEHLWPEGVERVADS